MARPKLSEEKKKVSKSFALEQSFSTLLDELIPAGQRSEWIAEVVINALHEFKALSPTN